MHFYNHTKEGYLYQAGLRINNSLGDAKVKDAVAAYGYTTEKLNEGVVLLKAAEDMYEQQEKEYGDAENAAQLHDEIFKELHEWVSGYKEIAKIALADKPQLLEKLGIVVKG